ncbi:hypothetical protein BROUX41_005066 [Berkeleyomyces rouxiae]|uniref:uncharacterized protein n=1 Tax=Berkeleyomyces rouxiae TaxID=2035830 RepID=UPI003B7A7661
MAGLPPAVINIVIMLGMMQVSKRVPFDDPNVLNMVRGGYILSNVIILGLYLVIQAKVQKKKDLTVLKYVEPAPMGSTEEPKLVATTIHEYDMSQLRTLMRGQVTAVAIMCVLHLYMKYTNPLLIQSILPLKTALEANLVKIHIFGKPAVGDLKRPFKAAAGFAQSLQGTSQTDAKSVKAAERAGRGGAKEE